ncbi:hypothetical protein GCM10009733_008530 [Nonomuraea maheshkhaliensis]|uniref:Uncharacterized protein n=1 Tax=Nonomuraea maheshkhaliensis TaxID=419590 RepID=A0ABP4QKP7_9ACTN
MSARASEMPDEIPEDDVLESLYFTDEAQQMQELTWGMLKRLAADQPDDAKVVLSSDPEGNRFTPLGMVSPNAHFVPTPDGWDNEVVGKPRPGSTSCLLLWPL